MNVARYRKKPVIIAAIQYLGRESMHDVVMFTDGAAFPGLAGTMEIKTLEGVMLVERGDFIIKGVRGEFYPCKPDIFAETYEEVDK